MLRAIGEALKIQEPALKKIESGGPPPTPPVKASKISNNLTSATHGPHIVGGALGAGVDGAAAEVHAPCAARVVRVLSRRPVVARLHAGKRPLLV